MSRSNRLAIQTIFAGAFLSHCTLAIGQYSDTTYRIFENKSFAIPSTDRIGAIKGITIQNSFPKGDRHTDSSGKSFGIAIFWTRVINETADPLELTINFPADSLSILSSPGSYLKLFLPPDTMTLDKVPLYNYGVTGLRSFLDTGLNKPTRLRRTINPKEEFLFYTGVVRYRVSDHVPGTRERGLHQEGGGVTRTGLLLKEQNLFYRISIDDESSLIPCGQIVFKK
jgi:hypothetical protein